ncbi:hypothetical protein OG21DRAFT_1307567 [Imleria badia]|nr:hypothetical protein OG21DRAFT_1307567 [Imleria badia]
MPALRKKPKQYCARPLSFLRSTGTRLSILLTPRPGVFDSIHPLEIPQCQPLSRPNTLFASTFTSALYGICISENNPRQLLKSQCARDT